jgi:tetratricopeptide (TPR) repeat protein
MFVQDMILLRVFWRSSIVLFAMLPLAGCGAPASSSLESVVVAARSGEDRDAFELAIGLADEAADYLSRSPDVVVRANAAASLARASFAEVKERMAADVVIWVNVERAGDKFVIQYGPEASKGELRAPITLTADVGELFSVPRRIAADTLSSMQHPPLDVAQYPAWPAPSSSSVYVGYLRALTQSTSEKEAERVAMFAALTPSLENYPPAVLELGRAYLDLAGKSAGTAPHYDHAEQTLRRAFQLDLRYPPARALLASYFAKRGRSEEAIKLLQEGLVNHPKFPGFHDQLGYVLRYAGLMERSIESYRRCQALDQGLENLVASQDQITKSLIYLGRYSDALASHAQMESFVHRLGRTPDEKEWFYRGVIHLYAGEREQALEAFRRGEELDASSVWTTFGRGYAGMARIDREEVSKVLDELEQHVVVDGERHYRLVHFATFLEQPERALKHLEASIRGGFFNAPYIAKDPLISGLRSHSGFAPLLLDAEQRHLALKASSIATE